MCLSIPYVRKVTCAWSLVCRVESSDGDRTDHPGSMITITLAQVGHLKMAVGLFALLPSFKVTCMWCFVAFKSYYYGNQHPYTGVNRLV